LHAVPLLLNSHAPLQHARCPLAPQAVIRRQVWVALMPEAKLLHWQSPLQPSTGVSPSRQVNPVSKMQQAR
jgi:hypothetical protein